MRQQWSRRGFLGAATALVAAGTAACSSRGGGDTDASRPVTVHHIFGETTVSEPPTRVVCAGYTGQDELLALGVVPIAVTDWFGGQPFAVWPWARGRLGDAKPVVLDLDDGIQVRRIAELKPDLIVATNAGLDADTYQQLTAIAPTLAQSGGDAFFEPWQVQAEAIGQAVHQGTRMQSLIAGVQSGFTAAAAEHPGFAGRTVALLSGRLDRGKPVAETGWRVDFLRRFGLAPVETSDRLADVGALIWATESDDERAALLADPDVAALAKRSVFTTKEQAGAIAFGSVLSYPVVTAALPGMLAKIIG